MRWMNTLETYVADHLGHFEGTRSVSKCRSKGKSVFRRPCCHFAVAAKNGWTASATLFRVHPPRMSGESTKRSDLIDV